MNRLDGKTALVTGATGGIGEATASQFLTEGANVMLVGRSAEKLEATAGRLGSKGTIIRHVADATDEAATAAAVAATLESFGGLDIVFANAGIEGAAKPIELQTLDEFETVINTNVVGVWLTMKHAVSPMKQRGGGSIIAVSSMLGLISFPGFVAYSASKHAVCGLVKTAAIELGESGIRANAICPGPIDNRMMQSVAEQVAPSDPGGARAMIEGLVPMKRYGTNEEVAKLAVFLASDEASYCNGGTYTVDGGFTAT